MTAPTPDAWAQARKTARIHGYHDDITGLSFAEGWRLGRAQAAADRERVGICGDRTNSAIGGISDSGAVCDQPAGHAGWHGADNPSFAGIPSRMSWTVDEQGWVANLSDRDEAIAAAEARGRAGAIADLRDETAFWTFMETHRLGEDEAEFAQQAPIVAADYLEAKGRQT